MNTAMTEILSSATGVNIGLMRFSNEAAGARVIYPVRDVAQHLCDDELCDDNTNFEGAKSTVRQELIDTATGMGMAWFTPTVGAMVEAANYYLGRPVEYGKSRWIGETQQVHQSESGRHSRISHRDSYTGGNTSLPPGCTEIT